MNIKLVLVALTTLRLINGHDSRCDQVYRELDSCQDLKHFILGHAKLAGSHLVDFLVDVVIRFSLRKLHIVSDPADDPGGRKQQVIMMKILSKARTFSSIIINQGNVNITYPRISHHQVNLISGVFVLSDDSLIMDSLAWNDQIWLVNHSAANLQKLAKIRPGFDSNVYTFKDGNAGIELFEVFSHGSFTKVSKIGDWTEDLGLEIPILEKWERRSDLTGVHIRTATLKVRQNVDGICPRLTKQKFYLFVSECSLHLLQIRNWAIFKHHRLHWRHVACHSKQNKFHVSSIKGFHFIKNLNVFD